jgi:O-antigen/teichoic acid export membrane protein
MEQQENGIYFSLRSRSFKDVSQLTIAGAVAGVMGILSILIIARILTKAEYAVYSTVLVTWIFINNCLDLRLNELIMVRLTREVNNLRDAAAKFLSYAGLQLGLGLVGFSIFISAAGFLSKFFFGDSTWANPFLCGGAILIFGTFYPLIESICRYYGRFFPVAVVISSSAAIRLACLIGFGLVGEIQLIHVLLIEAGVHFFRISALYIYSWVTLIRHNIKLKDLLRPAFTELQSVFSGEKSRKFWHDAIFGSLTIKVRMLGNRMDSLILARLTPMGVVADFNLAKRFIAPMTVVNSSVYSVYYPQVVRGLDNRRGNIFDCINRWAWTNAGVISVIGLILCGGVWGLLHFHLLPVDYARTLAVLIILCAGYSVHAWFFWVRPAVYSMNLLRLGLLLDCLAVAIYLIVVSIVYTTLQLNAWIMASLSVSYQIPFFVFLSLKILSDRDIPGDWI